jgi:hypothetical protein
MPKPMTFDPYRVLINIKIPKLKEICPKTKLCYSNGTFYMIYRNKGKTFPSIGEIDGETSDVYKSARIKCYLSKRDTLDIIEEVMFPNIEKRAMLADLIEELSKLHNTENKKIEDVQIEHDKIEEIYNRYKEHFSDQCTLYKLCYYWCGLCIALDFRIYEGKPTVIKRSLIVKDILAYLREQMKREKFGDSWGDVVEKIDPSEYITGIKPIYVKGYEKTKNGKKIQVDSHVRLSVTKE